MMKELEQHHFLDYKNQKIIYGQHVDVLPVDLEEIVNIVKQTRVLIDNREKAAAITTKGVADYATQVDESVQAYLSQTLAAKYPEIEFLGEEHYEAKEHNDYYWIVDPVDGTTNLIHDYRMSAVSVALAYRDQVLCGILYLPYCNEIYTAVRGHGAFCNGKQIHVSDVTTMDRSLISIGTSPYYKEMAHQNFSLFEKIFCACEDIRRSGSAVIDFVNIAAGRSECFFERNLKIWDYAASWVLIEEAGGSLLDYEGNPLTLNSQNDIIAGNGIVNRIIVDMISS